MCQLCLLGADSDVLLSIWQHVNLRLKLRQLLRLCRCARMRQSLLTPAAFALDEAHIRNTNDKVQDLGASLAAIRLPSFLSHIRALAVSVTVTHGYYGNGRTFPQLAPIDQTAASSAVLADEKDGDEGGRQFKRSKPASIGLASLSHLHTLALLQLRCHCAARPPYGQEHKEREPSDVTLPYLPQLRVLILNGSISKHCMSLLLSCPSQCPQLCFIDFRNLHCESYGPATGNAPPLSTSLLTFMSWLGERQSHRAAE